MDLPNHRQPRRLVIFDDGRGRFGPLTDRRAAFSLPTGSRNNRVRIETSLGVKASDLHVPEPLAESCRAHATDAHFNEPLRRARPATFQQRASNGTWGPVSAGDDASILLVNGRWSGGPPIDPDQVLRLETGGALVQHDGQLVATCLSPDAAQDVIDADFATSALPRDVKQQQIPAASQRVLIERPWHIQDDLPGTLALDLAATTVPATAGARQKGPRHGAFVQFGDYPLHLSREAIVQPSAVFNTEQGPVVVEGNALIGAQSVLEGPCCIGPGAQITCHTHIRPSTVIGAMCKIGGEVSHSIIFDNSNKAHAGYLGNSIVGEWVNLGAQTNVSNLKNTYGEIRMQLDADAVPEPTGRTHLGVVIGDFVRTAIGTRLLSGACVGTGAMVALSGFAPKFIPAFAFLTDAGNADERSDPDRFLQTAQRMMERRNTTLSNAQAALLRQLHTR